MEKTHIIAFDFDGTLAITKYPDIIKPIPGIIAFAKSVKRHGGIIILNTCRHDKDLDDAVAFCKEQGLVFDYVNENAKEMVDKFGDCRKIYADIYIDDHAMPVEFVKDLMKKQIQEATENVRN